MNALYLWEIIALETPKIQRNCKRCANNLFECSEKFRINSNKKLIDVWLIYKCTQCDSTWKMDIIVRQNGSTIDPLLFRAFQENNVELAWHYAFNKNVIGNNRVQVNWHIPFSIKGDLQDLLEKEDDWVTVNLQSKYELGISIRKVLQRMFPISNSKMECLLAEGDVIVNSSKNTALSKKVGASCQIEINRKALLPLIKS